MPVNLNCSVCGGRYFTIEICTNGHYYHCTDCFNTISPSPNAPPETEGLKVEGEQGGVENCPKCQSERWTIYQRTSNGNATVILCDTCKTFELDIEGDGVTLNGGDDNA